MVAKVLLAWPPLPIGVDFWREDYFLAFRAVPLHGDVPRFVAVKWG